MSRENIGEQQANLEEAEKQHMRLLRIKHPDCIPIRFARHKEASPKLPEPQHSLILFKADLTIEQAMRRLYQQIQYKPLQFFCLQVVKEKAKYIRLKPETPIQDLFKRFGRNESLLLIYADEQLGMQGIKKMEKCLIWVLVILAAFWAVLFGLTYFLGWSEGPPSEVVGSRNNSAEWNEEIN